MYRVNLVRTLVLAVLVVFLVLAVSVVWTRAASVLTPPAHAANPTRVVLVSLPDCVTEDQTDTRCVWDAEHRGNGIGRSFRVNRHGERFYLSHARAHTLATL